jgi:hypothetical protein
MTDQVLGMGPMVQVQFWETGHNSILTSSSMCPWPACRHRKNFWLRKLWENAVNRSLCIQKSKATKVRENEQSAYSISGQGNSVDEKIINKCLANNYVNCLLRTFWTPNSQWYQNILGLEYCKQVNLLTLLLHWICVFKSDPFTAFSHDFLSQKTFLCLQWVRV